MNEAMHYRITGYDGEGDDRVVIWEGRDNPTDEEVDAAVTSLPVDFEPYPVPTTETEYLYIERFERVASEMAWRCIEVLPVVSHIPANTSQRVLSIIPLAKPAPAADN